MDKKEFGKFIAECRREQNLTQAQLAEQIHVTDKAVSRWENGHGYPDVNIMQPLAEALHVSLAELMNARKDESGILNNQVMDETVTNTITYMNETHQADNQRKWVKYGIIGIAAAFIFAVLYAQNNEMPTRQFEAITVNYTAMEGGSIKEYSFYPGIEQVQSCQFIPNENLHNGDTVTFQCTLKNNKTLEKQIVLEHLLYRDDNLFPEAEIPFLDAYDVPEEVLLRTTEDEGYQILIYVKETERTYISYEYDNLYFQDGKLCQVVFNGTDYDVGSGADHTVTRNIKDLEADIEQHLEQGWKRR